MQEQLLDTMDIEVSGGITIKLQLQDELQISGWE
jgi:translation elongation factor EF-4